MKQSIIITLGLPCSGKTMWSKKKIDSSPETLIRVSRADIRNMLGSVRTESRNSLINKLENASVDVALANGYSVIVDATNFTTINKWRNLAKELKMNFEVKDFTDTPLDVCIQRDQQKTNPIGKATIVRMYEQYLKNGFEY